jgi:hypothetical protein
MKKKTQIKYKNVLLADFMLLSMVFIIEAKERKGIGRENGYSYDCMENRSKPVGKDEKASSCQVLERFPHLWETLPHLREVLPHLREGLPHLRESLPHLSGSAPAPVGKSPAPAGSAPAPAGRSPTGAGKSPAGAGTQHLGASNATLSACDVATGTYKGAVPMVDVAK